MSFTFNNGFEVITGVVFAQGDESVSTRGWIPPVDVDLGVYQQLDDVEKTVLLVI